MASPQPPSLFTEAEITARVATLAAEISRDYADRGELLLVGVLKGAFIFLADLARRITVPRQIDFVALSTYRGGATDPGPPRPVMDLRSDIAGRHVVVVEDIVDTGRTLGHLMPLLAARNPASVAICTLLYKGARQEVEITPDYVGFEVPDRWVVGYGLDHAERYRALPYIGVVDVEAGG